MGREERGLPPVGVVGLCLVALFACCAVAVPQDEPRAPGYHADFERGGAPGWELEQNWRVSQAPEHGAALHGQGHGWARLAGPRWGNCTIRLALNLVRGTVHVNCRVDGPRRYFVGVQARNVYLQKQTGPQAFSGELARGTSARGGLNRWRQVAIRLQGGRVRVSVDGQQLIDYTDPNPLGPGGLAFETIENSEAWIDDVDVSSAGGGGVPALKPVAPVVPTEPGKPKVKRPVLRGGRVGVARRGEKIRPLPITPPATPPHIIARAFPLVQGSPFKWVRTGGPPGGLGYDIRMRMDNPGVMYVTDNWAGVFASKDGGRNWSPSNGQGTANISVRAGATGEAIPVFCLTVDPHNENILWAGTQNLRGIFRSGDGGKTWAKMDNGVVEKTSITFRGFTVDPRTSNIVYAAGEIGSWAWAGSERRGKTFDMTRGVVYRTDDGGKHWREVWRGDDLARYIWISPQDPDVVYISTGIFDREAANSKPLSDRPGGEGVLKSTNGGKTWQHANHGLENLYVGSLFMHPRNPNILLAGTGNNSYRGGGGVYLTTDGGSSWEATLPDETITAVEFSLSDPNIAYAGSQWAIYRSEDGGKTWRKVTETEWAWGGDGITAGFPIDFQVDPHDPNRVFANNYGGGNFLSTDGGQTWTDASRGYTGAQVRGLSVDPGNSQRVFVSGRSGVFVSNNGGGDWAGLSYPLSLCQDGDGMALDPKNGQHVLASVYSAGTLYQSHNGGHDWQLVATLPGGNVGWRTIAFARPSPGFPSTVYAGTAGFIFVGTFDVSVAGKGIWVSHDNGTTWTPANNSLSANAHVATLAVHPGDARIVYAATTNHGLLKTTNGGKSWVRLGVGKGLPGSVQALSVAVDPVSPNTVYCGFVKAGAFRSSDNGVTWTPCAAGMPAEASVSEIVVDPTQTATVYAADLSSGVYRSVRGGVIWQPMSNGLGIREVNALAISSDGRTLYAATEGQGVFRLDVGGK